MKISRILKASQKESMRQNWIVAFATTGLLSTMLGFVGAVSWLTTDFNLSLEGFPTKDIVQLCVGIIFLIAAAQLEDKREAKRK